MGKSQCFTEFSKYYLPVSTASTLFNFKFHFAKFILTKMALTNFRLFIAKQLRTD